MNIAPAGRGRNALPGPSVIKAPTLGFGMRTNQTTADT